MKECKFEIGVSGANILKDFIETCQIVKSSKKGANIGEKKDKVLLGQYMFSGKMLFQIKEVMLYTDLQVESLELADLRKDAIMYVDSLDLKTTFPEFYKLCEEEVKEEFQKNRNMLEDIGDDF